VRILGVVLNKADLESEGYYYYSKYYYRYYGSPPPPEAQAGAADTT
jgi:Mrp family chromosome partitioning ATPase